MNNDNQTVRDKLQMLYNVALAEATGNILPFWMNHVVDHENGGFYGMVLTDRTPVREAQKGLVLNARLIWTFASAYRVFGDASYLETARRAYEYFIRYFWDEEHTGAYWMLDCRGAPVDTQKYIYGQAFAIYALSEYYRATGEACALERAVALFHTLERCAFDPVNGGYFEAYERAWQGDIHRQVSPVNVEGGGVKSMNTHLHLLEAYTNLLRVWDSPEIRAKVRRNLHTLLDRIVDRASYHYKMFFDERWKPVYPNISYGHDIEGSWLMLEACEVLGEADLFASVSEVCVNMAQACLNEAIGGDGSLLYEKNPISGHVDARTAWWSQAEAVVGFLNAHEIGGSEPFLDAAVACLDYIDRQLVDRQYGEWFASAEETAKRHDGIKVDAWKCPYHNSRMCFEIVERHRKRAREQAGARGAVG